MKALVPTQVLAQAGLIDELVTASGAVVRADTTWSG